jgi:nicotinamidase-related amidase/predicted enzyme related to lactoylglutathione lyase
MEIHQLALTVRDYDEAIAFYVERLGFELLEDTPLGAGKRWVRVRPVGATGAGLLLARAEGERQVATVGNQSGGRVFVFLHSDDFERDYRRLVERGVSFVRPPTEAPYGTVAVFEDLYGNRFDLIGPRRERGASALLLVDLQQDFAAKLPTDERAALTRSVVELLGFARSQGWAVIWIRSQFEPDLSDALLEVRRKRIPVVIRGTAGGELLPELAVADGEAVVVKKRYSAFFRTALDGLLANLAPERLVIAGINTHACVRATAVDAYQRDFEVVIARDSVASHDRAHHEVSLRYMDGKIGEALSNREISARFRR